MTVKLSISVPDDVAGYLQSSGNASAAVTEAVRRMLPEARRARQRAAARAYAEFLRAEPALVAESNNVALRGVRW
ncbi:ribosomal protein L13 [Actinoplanes tereljensis]|uniref:Antitoxin n=1 Tax=Paractinoplanes tereljensis TaxID=571912 RepID=A0A919NXT5_9ACTN|nr:hypothetical protein [Actinoplanes tereljensis]GIF25317.1 hypothetical protein Ate02nite_80470 [Actinoplanes tereljensis]